MKYHWFWERVDHWLTAYNQNTCIAAAWQSRIAAKPLQGVLGFLIASFIWFAVPISIATSTGLAYLTLASGNSSLVLSQGDIDSGIILFSFVLYYNIVIVLYLYYRTQKWLS